MFDYCVEVYFKTLWAGQLKEKDVPDSIQDYYKKESYSVMVDHAKAMVHTSVQDVVNSRKMPNRDEMSRMGSHPSDWLSKKNGGGYKAMSAPEAGSGTGLGLCYGGSTNRYCRRLPEQHFEPATWDKYPRNELYKAMKAGRVTEWSTTYEFDTAFAFADEWSLLRQKLLESFINAMFVIYRAGDFKRVGPEVQIAKVWAGVKLNSKSDMQDLDLSRGFAASNRSIAYAEESEACVDPFKHVFEGTRAFVAMRSNRLKIGMGAGRWRYHFNLTEEQQDIIRVNNVRYGIFQAHQTNDGAPHVHQYAMIGTSTDARFEDAATLAFSFEYRPLLPGGQRSKQTEQMWIQAENSRGERTSTLCRALFVLSVKEYARGAFDEKAGPDRFAFPGRESTEEPKIWETPSLDASFHWIKDNLEQHVHSGSLTCPWCRATFEDANIDVLAEAWRCHLRHKNVQCKQQLLEQLGLSQDEISELVIFCHCEERFASQHQLERHWQLQKGKECLERENKDRAIIGEPLIDVTDDDRRCQYCGEERTMIDEKKHLSAIKHKSCLVQHNADQIAAGKPIFEPVCCRNCGQSARNQGEVNRHLFAPTHIECLEFEREYRVLHQMPELDDPTQWCQETSCEKDWMVPQGKRKAELITKPGFRYSAIVASYMTTHYQKCHPDAARPKKKDLLTKPHD